MERIWFPIDGYDMIAAFWADVEASGEADYNDWHTREHMPERCGVPGFLRGRRWPRQRRVRPDLFQGFGVGGQDRDSRIIGCRQHIYWHYQPWAIV